MKKIAFIFSLLLCISCSSDDDAGNVITIEFEQIELILPQNEWIISKFTSNQTDQTIEFESFIFNFETDGTFTSQNDLFTEAGTWEYISTAQLGEQLSLRFMPATPPFDKISKNWQIISLSNSKIELSAVNENDELELLTLTSL